MERMEEARQVWLRDFNPDTPSAIFYWRARYGCAPPRDVRPTPEDLDAAGGPDSAGGRPSAGGLASAGGPASTPGWPAYVPPYAPGSLGQRWLCAVPPRREGRWETQLAARLRADSAGNNDAPGRDGEKKKN